MSRRVLKAVLIPVALSYHEYDKPKSDVKFFMTIIVDKPKYTMQLRKRAEEHLKTGGIPATSHWTMGIDALRLLHQLSSNPASAEDALKLLHELQVHQVELDLQNEEIATHEQAIAGELNLYRELYDAAPLGYFLVDREGNVIQGNLAGAALFGLGQNDLTGKRIDKFLVSENRQQLRELLLRVAESGASDSCKGMAGDGVNAPRRLQFMASGSSKHEYVHLACCEYPDNS
jgi:PAS domain-containing protein